MSGNGVGPLLRLQNIHLVFDEVQALNGVDFDLYPGEVHAVVGERRAGKSSLVQILSGGERKTRGTILIDGKEIEHLTPRSAFRQGIGIVHQYPNIIPSLTVIQNIYVGRLTGWLLQPKLFPSLSARCHAMFAMLHEDIRLNALAENLSSSEREMVEIVRALLFEPRILILDEISSRLTSSELETVVGIISDLRSKGKGVIYIASDLDEVFTIADRVTLLKNGQRKGTELVQNMDRFRVLQLAYNFIFNASSQEKAEKELFLVELFNETLISDLPLGILILTSSGLVSVANKATRKILGIKEKDAAGMGIEGLLSMTGVHRVPDIVSRIHEGERHTWNKLKLGADRFIKLKTFPMHNENMDFIGTVLMLEDVSMDHFVKEYLLRAEKITSIAELAAGVAHEINNPLGIIKNYVILLKSMTMEAEAREHVTKIETELGRIVDTIGSLLSYSRSQQNPVRNLDIAELIEETVTLLSHRLREKNVSLECRVEPRLLVPGDENKLKQLLINLLANSIEAVLEQGKIIIEAAKSSEGTEAVLRVTDNGYGISQEISASVFTPFFTTKMDKKNVGLGLSICQNIVESHGGGISFESKPGIRTTFKIRIPCVH